MGLVDVADGGQHAQHVEEAALVVGALHRPHRVAVGQGGGDLGRDQLGAEERGVGVREDGHCVYVCVCEYGVSATWKQCSGLAGGGGGGGGGKKGGVRGCFERASRVHRENVGLRAEAAGAGQLVGVSERLKRVSARREESRRRRSWAGKAWKKKESWCLRRAGGDPCNDLSTQK